MKESSIERTNFVGCNATAAEFYNSRLATSDLSNGDWRHVLFSNISFLTNNFHEADLHHTQIDGCSIQDSNLLRVNMWFAVINNAKSQNNQLDPRNRSLFQGGDARRLYYPSRHTPRM